jgi:hypothetical protein
VIASLPPIRIDHSDGPALDDQPRRFILCRRQRFPSDSIESTDPELSEFETTPAVTSGEEVGADEGEVVFGSERVEEGFGTAKMLEVGEEHGFKGGGSGGLGSLEEGDVDYVPELRRRRCQSRDRSERGVLTPSDFLSSDLMR